TLLRSTVSFANAGAYAVVLSKVAGVVTSAVATLTVSCPTVTLGPPSLPSGTAGIAYSQSLSASGGVGPYTFTVTGGTLPAGLSLSGVGVLGGTPSATGTNSFTLAATDTNGCSGSLACTLAVTGGQLAIPDPQSAGAVVLVNSQSARYPDFQHFIQPYLDN